MFSTLNYLLSDKDPSCSLTSAFFYEDHFTHLYQEGLKRIRDKSDDIHYNSLIKALSELNSMQEPINNRENREINHIYEKNIDWLAQKQEKIQITANFLKEKELKRLEIEKKQLKPAKIAIHLPFDYIGPIKGWKTRFLDFKRKKSLTFEPNPEDFRPFIDENSRKIANFDSNLIRERVEDRLIRKGKETSRKMAENNEKLAILQDLITEKPKNNRKKQEIMDFAEKLYNDAKIHAENRENLIKTEETRFSHKPNINKSKDFQYNRKPLYQAKVKSPEKSLEKPKKIGFNKQEFESFLKRNDNLRENKQKSIENLMKLKEKAEIIGCSFQPEINKETISILCKANKGEKSLIDRQNEFQTRKLEFKAMISKKNEEKFKKICTFKPKISKSLEKIEVSLENKKKNKPSYRENRDIKKKSHEKDLKVYKEKIKAENGKLDEEILAFS